MAVSVPIYDENGQPRSDGNGAVLTEQAGFLGASGIRETVKQPITAVPGLIAAQIGQIAQHMKETDARIALAGATAGKPGIVIIAGTGSIAYGVNKDGEVARAGGWGPTLGDEGSGTYIGRRALEAVMTAYDYRRHEDTALTEKVCRFFNVSSPPELPAVIYNPNTNVLPQIAQLSKLVVETAQDGDVIAIEILKDAAYELARAIKAVIEQLNMRDDAFRIGYVGGVFSAGDLILQPLRENIAAFAPHAVLAPPLHKPAVGAAQMAMANFLDSRDQLLVGQQLASKDQARQRH